MVLQTGKSYLCLLSVHTSCTTKCGDINSSIYADHVEPHRNGDTRLALMRPAALQGCRTGYNRQRQGLMRVVIVTAQKKTSAGVLLRGTLCRGGIRPPSDLGRVTFKR